MIDDSMWSNENFAEMPMGARLLLIGIINHADDQGRMKANPSYLRAQIFPYDDIAAVQIQEWLELIQVNDTLILYLNDGKQFLQLNNWWRYQSLQYAHPSQHPRPSGWKDRVRKTLTKGVIVTCNWQKVNGDPIEDTCDMDGNPIKNGTTIVRSTPVDNEKCKIDSPERSPERSGEDTTTTITTNLTKLTTTNLTTDAGSGSGGDFSETTADSVVELWKENMPGSFTPIVENEISGLIDTYTAAEVDTAIRLAVKANKRTIPYVSGILKRRSGGGDREKVPRAAPVTGNVSIGLATI